MAISIYESMDGFTRHSIERNIRYLLDLIEQERLIVAPLLTHQVSPTEGPAVYEGLRKQKDTYIGVVFDWSKVC